MKQQTAVEWFLQELIRCGHFKEGQINITLEQAKQMEKEQIINAYKATMDDSVGANFLGEQYYNETYESNT